MNRPTILFGTALLASLVVLAALAGGVTAAVEPAATAPQVATDETTNTTTENATAPGAQLAGIIGVQQAEVTGDIDNRSFGVRIANADSDAERAAIIADRQAETSQQVATQAERLAELRAARDAGNLTQGEYRARVAIVASQATNAERTADQLNRTARDLPEAVRERNGINETAIDRLRTDARNLSGPETAAIARSIGGTTARNPMAGTRGPFGERGPSGEMPAGDAVDQQPSSDGPGADRAGGPEDGEPSPGDTNTTPAGGDADSPATDRNAGDSGSGDGPSNAGESDSDDTGGSSSGASGSNPGGNSGGSNRP